MIEENIVGNSFCNKKDCLNCPLNNWCKGSDKNE